MHGRHEQAVPLDGEVLLFQVNGRRNHPVALVDVPGTRIAAAAGKEHWGRQAVNVPGAISHDPSGRLAV